VDFLIIRAGKRVNPSTTTLAIWVVTVTSDGMYSTDCDSSEEEDDPEYYESSSDESNESVNHQSTSEEEDAFFLFLWKLKSP